MDAQLTPKDPRVRVSQKTLGTQPRVMMQRPPNAKKLEVVILRPKRLMSHMARKFEGIWKLVEFCIMEYIYWTLRISGFEDL